jgi:hypothetical protein
MAELAAFASTFVAPLDQDPESLLVLLQGADAMPIFADDSSYGNALANGLGVGGRLVVLEIVALSMYARLVSMYRVPRTNYRRLHRKPNFQLPR